MVRDERQLTARRAVEALRNGVPNRAAVEMLGCRQPKAEAAFAELLARAGDTHAGAGRAQGMLVSGDFGAGKSHLLVHLERLALAHGFVCSTVAVSKETPLYDLGKVFSSAVDNARMPDRGGRLFEELGAATDRNSAHFAVFAEWVETAASNGILHEIFPAGLAVYEGARDPELNARIESFWGGDRIRVSEIKRGLRLLGHGRRRAFRAPRVGDLPPQRLRFAVELMRGAGYKGWVVLLDEIELVRRRRGRRQKVAAATSIVAMRPSSLARADDGLGLRQGVLQRAAGGVDDMRGRPRLVAPVQHLLPGG